MILERRAEEREVELRTYEAATKVVCTFIAACGSSDKKQAKAGLKAAEKLSLMPPKKKKRRIPSVKEVERLFGGSRG